MKICRIEGCNKPVKARGWCSMHYARWERWGDPEKVAFKRFTSLEESFLARTEWRGDCLIWVDGNKDNYGYGRMWTEGKNTKAHRYAWEREHGEIPEGYDVDHKNCYNPSCVNYKHLRLATHSQNMQNRSGAAKNNKSTGIRNVYRHTSGRYYVSITRLGVTHYYGTYDTLEEATMVAEENRNELFGEYAGRG